MDNLGNDVAATAEPIPPVLQKLQKWADYPSFGQRMAVGFIPGKTPLSEEILASWSFADPPKHPHTVAAFLDTTAARGDEIGAFLDLSAHECLYADDIPPHVHYYQVQLVAKKFPPLDAIASVAKTAQEYWRQYPDKLIAIHCAYGFNRTGFVVCSYLVLHARMTVAEALAAFAEARPPGVKHEDFIEELHRRYDPHPQGGLSAALGQQQQPAASPQPSAFAAVSGSAHAQLPLASAGTVMCAPAVDKATLASAPAVLEAEGLEDSHRSTSAAPRAQQHQLCTSTSTTSTTTSWGAPSSSEFTCRKAAEPILTCCSQLQRVTIYEESEEGSDSNFAAAGIDNGLGNSDALVDPIAQLLERQGSGSRSLSRSASLGLARALTGDFVSSSPPRTLARMSPSLAAYLLMNREAHHVGQRSTSLVSNESFMSGRGGDGGLQGLAGVMDKGASLPGVIDTGGAMVTGLQHRAQGPEGPAPSKRVLAQR